MENTLVSRKRKQTQDLVSAMKFYTSSTPKKDSQLMQDKKDSVNLSSYKFIYARTEDPASDFSRLFGKFTMLWNQGERKH